MSRVLKSHIHIVRILANLYAIYDNLDLDKLLFFKQAMTSPYWQKFEKAMDIEFQFFIKNDTWKYRDTLLVQAFLINHWVF